MNPGQSNISGMAMAAACAPRSYEIPATGGALVELQATPAGAFRPSDGRPMIVEAWRIDARIARQVIERFNARETPPVLDYEHQTLTADNSGQLAPAAGFFESLEWREGKGLFATAKLTERATRLVAAGEYRYHSPVFSYDKKTGEILSLLMGALTNNPAIDGMNAIAIIASRAAARGQLSHEELAICHATAVDAAEFVAVKASDIESAGLHDQLTADELSICRATGIDPAAFVAAKTQDSDSTLAAAQLTDDERAICNATGIDATVFAALKAQHAAPAHETSPLTADELSICRATGIDPAAFAAVKHE